jgi:hypothetical protein
LQYGILPRAHWIETEAALRDPGKCKLSCALNLSVCLLPCYHGLFAEKCWCKRLDTFYARHSTELSGSFCCSPCKSERNCGSSSF